MASRRQSANRTTDDLPPLRDVFALWLKIGLLSFGGPAAQIALMHRLVVNEKRWLSEQQYLNALSFCMLLPGPEAMQLATYAGWRQYGVVGGLVAGSLFVLPGAVIIAALAALYAVYGNVSIVDALFLGIKAAVVVIVLQALLRVAGKALQSAKHWIIALCSFVGIFFVNIPFPMIVVCAGLYGFYYLEMAGSGQGATIPDSQSFQVTIKTVLLWTAAWTLPFMIIVLWDVDSILIEIGLFFSKLAVVTFGGAYAVLAYLGQEVVVDYGWLTAREMMDGLGLAETTPGPLILVTEFVGFIAGFKEGGLPLAMAAALMTLWVTFIPCFLWIFAGAPYLEWISEQPRLRSALSAITASVVGVILNLSVWFAMHVWFERVDRHSVGLANVWQPEWQSINILAVVLTCFCAFAAFRLRWNIVWILATSPISGLLFTVLIPLF